MITPEEQKALEWFEEAGYLSRLGDLDQGKVLAQGLRQREIRIKELEDRLIMEDEDVATKAETSLAVARRVVEVAREIEGCPFLPDRATYNEVKGIDSAPPYQAVLNVSVAWTRWKNLKNSLAEYDATPKPEAAG